MAISIAFTPLYGAPKANNDQKKKESVAATKAKSAAKPAPQRPVAKAQPRPQSINKAPQRPPSVKQSAPQRSVSRAPDRPKPTVQRAPQRPPSVKQHAPERAVAKAPSQPKRNVNKAPSRENIARSERQPEVRKAPEVAQSQRVSPAERKPQRAPSVDRPKPQEFPKARGQVDRSPETRPDREIVRVPENRPSQDDRKSTAAAARAAAAAERGGLRVDRPNRNERDVNRSAVARDLERQPARDLTRGGDNRRDQEARRARDLTVTGRDRQQELARRQDLVRGPRGRDNVDRRPAPLDSLEERRVRAARAEVRDRVAKERRRDIAQLNERNRDRIESFGENRQRRVAALANERRVLRNSVRVDNRTQVVVENRPVIRNYWRDRGDEIRYRVADRRDYLFNDNWWEDCNWRDHHVRVSNPWWWWQPARWSTVNVFLDAGWNEPVLYDYGTDVIYNDDLVYVRGEAIGTPVEYSRRVIELANPAPEVIAEAPVVETEWTPLGVWALVQENQGDAVMFFQLSVNKSGLISGAYSNVLTGESQPIEGQVDRATQRAAWHVGEQTEKVFEAGMANLTENQASCMVHFAPGEMQNWLLVRMESPDLPTQPAAVGEGP